MKVEMKSYDDRKGRIPRHKQASSKDDDLETFEDLYYYLCNKYDIVCELDPYTKVYPDGTTNSKCTYSFTVEQNALNLEYLIPDGLPTDRKPTGIFINHPHSLHAEVLEHNLNQWLTHDLDMLMVIPSNSIRPPYWHKYIEKYHYKGIEYDALITNLFPLKEEPDAPNGYLNFKKRGKDTEFDSRNGYLVVRYYSKESLTKLLLRRYYGW